MTHESIVDLLSSYLDGEISADDRIRVDTHLRDCPACRAELKNIIAVTAALSAAPRQEMPADAASRLAAALEHEMGDAPVVRPARFRWATLPALGAIAAVLLVAVALGTFSLSASKGPSYAPTVGELADPGTSQRSAKMAPTESGGAGSEEKATQGAAESPAGEADSSRALPGPIYSGRPVGATDLNGFVSSKQSKALFGSHTVGELDALAARLAQSAKDDASLSKAMAVAASRHKGARITYAEQVLYEEQLSWLMSVQWQTNGQRKNEIFVAGGQGTILYP